MTPIKLVFVEDHLILLDTMEAMLKSVDEIELVGTASDHREAISTIERHAPDVIVTDLRMPGLNGIEMIIDFRRRFPRLKIAVMSMHYDLKLISGLEDHNVIGFMNKEVSSDEFVSCVKRVAEGNTHWQKEVLELRHGSRAPRPDHLKEPSKLINHILSKRERDVAKCIGDGLTNALIGESLNISEDTVKTHRKHLKRKLQLKTTAEIINWVKDNLSSLD